MASIHDSFKVGNNFRMGQNAVIEADVEVGDNVKIGHNVVLKSGTRVKNDVDLADYVKTTGICIIGNGIRVATGACISKSVIVNDMAFVGPGVMTNHTKNVMHKRVLREVQLITTIGYGAVIGSMCSLVAGLAIGNNVVVAAGSNVYKDIREPGVYGGSPVKKIRDLEYGFALKPPEGYVGYFFDRKMLELYLPNWLGLGVKERM